MHAQPFTPVDIVSEDIENSSSDVNSSATLTSSSLTVVQNAMTLLQLAKALTGTMFTVDSQGPSVDHGDLHVQHAPPEWNIDDVAVELGQVRKGFQTSY